MLSKLPLAMVAFVSLADARFSLPRADGDETIRCCPCLPSGLNPNDTTVTVTVTSPKETVTIDHTIVQPATTVVVTQTYTPESPSVVTPEVTVHPEPPAKIETVISASIGNSEPSPSPRKASTTTITKTAQPGGDGSESPKTVTVTLKPDQGGAGQVTNVAGESKSVAPTSLASNAAVTVTISPQKPDSQQSVSPSSPAMPSRSAEPSRPDSSQGNGVNTVTVAAATQPETSHTVVAAAKPSVKTVPFVQKPPSDETVTIVQNPASPSTTTVTLASNPSNPTIEAVPFVESPASPTSTTTATSVGSSSDLSAETTITFVQNPANPSSTPVAPTEASSSAGAETVTSALNPANPSVETVAFVPNPPNPITSSSPPQAAITTPPQVGTVSASVDHFTTLTQTVSSGGNINIEIIIINIFTGETICRKKGSGKPCDSKPKTHRFKPSGVVPCLTTGVFTETATAFNTVVVTVGPGMWSNGTAAAPTGVSPPLGTGTGSPVLRRGRVPLVRKRL
ncbi:hypothetical protein ACHAQJ_006519 [Trichoderma viride]